MSTRTDVPTTILARDDIEALRVANSVTFHQHGGDYFIRAHFRLLTARPLTKREQVLFPVNATEGTGVDRYRQITCDGATAWYRGDLTVERDEPRAAMCFFMWHSNAFDEAWKTITRSLHAGDTLTLIFRGDNNTDTIRAAGLHCDDLDLRVTRKDTHLRFKIARTVTLDNTARMIRRG